MTKIIAIYLMVSNIVWHVDIQKTLSRVALILYINEYGIYDWYASLCSKGEVM